MRTSGGEVFVYSLLFHKTDCDYLTSLQVNMTYLHNCLWDNDFFSSQCVRLH